MRLVEGNVIVHKYNLFTNELKNEVIIILPNARSVVVFMKGMIERKYFSFSQPSYNSPRSKRITNSTI